MKKNIGKNWIDESLHYIEKNRMQTFYNLILLVFVFMMIPGYISSLDSTTVEVDLPPQGKIIVQNDKANELYYQIWAEHYTNNKEYIEEIKDNGEKIPIEFTFSIVDFDYSNIEAKMNNYLSRYKPSNLIKDGHIYSSFVKNVKVKMISQSFVVESIKTATFKDGNIGQVVVTGVATQKYSDVEQAPKECSYTFGFERFGGKIYGTSLQTNCF